MKRIAAEVKKGIVAMIAHGHTNQEVAEHYGVSIQTVRLTWRKAGAERPCHSNARKYGQTFNLSNMNGYDGSFYEYKRAGKELCRERDAKQAAITDILSIICG